MPKNCVEIIYREYTRKFANGEELNDNKFVEECRELQAIFQKHEGTTDCQAAINYDLKFPKSMESMLDRNFKARRGTLLEEYTDKFLEGENFSDPAQHEEIIEGWIRKAVKDVEEEVAQNGLSE